MICHHCGSLVEIQSKIGRQQTCDHCGSPLHCCLNCRFYATEAYHQCRETEAEWVSDKKNANFCDYFKPADKIHTDHRRREEEARKKLDQLFRKK